MLQREVEKPLPAVVGLVILIMAFVAIVCCRCWMFALPEPAETAIPDVDR